MTNNWIAEVEQIDPNVAVYLAYIHDGDSQRSYSWSIDENAWVNVAAGDAPSTRESQALSFLAAHASALSLRSARARWDDDEDEPRLITRSARLSLGPDRRGTPEFVTAEVRNIVDPRIHIDLAGELLVLLISDDVPDDAARSAVTDAMTRIAEITGGSGQVDPESWV